MRYNGKLKLSLSEMIGMPPVSKNPIFMNPMTCASDHKVLVSRVEPVNTNMPTLKYNRSQALD